MPRIAWLFGLSAPVVLAAGALWVCPDGRCTALPLDQAGLAMAHLLREPRLDAFMRLVTWLGSLWLLLPLAGVGAFLLCRRGRVAQAGLLLAALAGATALSHAFKHAVARPRPDLYPMLVDLPADASFPSAHTMQAVAFALAAALVLPRPAPWRLLMLALAALLVGLSRIYLQVHYPSDVLVGGLAAAFWVLALRAAFTKGTPGAT